MSEPPGEPHPSGESPDAEDEPVAAPHGESAPPSGTAASENAPDGPTTLDRSPEDATTTDARPPAPAAPAAPTPTPAASAASAAPAAPAERAAEQPWWARGQAPPPPPGQAPPPYQPQPAPWAYAQQAPHVPPPAGLGWGRPAAFAAASAVRDRLSVHLIYEGVLAFIAIVLIIAMAATGPAHGLDSAFAQAGSFGLMATAFAFSMRTGAPNLAVATLTYLAGWLAAWLVTAHGWSKPAAFLVAILLSTLIGLLLGIVVAALSVPSWAVTIGAVWILQAIGMAVSKEQIIPMRFSGSYPTALWYGLFFVLSVGGGALWLIPAVRRPLSAAREPGDPARWLGLRAGLGAIAGLTVSSFLGGLAAIPLVMRVQAAETNATTEVVWVLAAVLLGGVSVFGRRAGVFGTLLGVTILALIQTMIITNDGPFWVQYLVVGLAALLGVAVSRGIESITDVLNTRTRPRPPLAPPPPSAMPPGPYGPPPGNAL